jgi:raffinose/stachyose/melibiose transport system substrate-binding protein
MLSLRVSAAVVGTALLLSGCGSDSKKAAAPSTASSSGTSTAAGSASASASASGTASAAASATTDDKPVTLTWWHNGAKDPLKGYFQTTADAYTAKHPNVKFKIEAIQNEAIQTKITVALQSNNPPDIFQQWGGGDLATQVKSGKVQDITEAAKDTVAAMGGSASGWQVQGKQYGLPYTVGMVGFWYRTDLFATAGITAPPTTMAELYTAIDKLKAAKLTPIAVGSKDKWPDAFYWGYFATKECTKDVLQQTSVDLKMEDPCYAKAGQDLEQFLAKKPFQNGFLGTPAQQGAASSAGLIANGKAAMELMGHWNGSVITDLTPDKKSLGDKLGFFPFPAVDGAAGDPKAAFGGGDGFSCTSKAPPACADFLNFLLSVDEQKKFAALNVGPPTTAGSETAVSDVNLQNVIKIRDGAPFIQLYFDKALPTAVGAALNDEIANVFAGASKPDKIVAAEAAAAAKN